MNDKIEDERIIAESNKVFKICFYIFCVAIYADIILKFNLCGLVGRMSFDLGAAEFWLMIGIESIFLLVVFYAVTFLLAGRGILICSGNCDCEQFNKKRYAAISAVFAVVLSVGMWTVRFCVGSFSGFTVGFVVVAATVIYIVTFLVAFAVLYLTFYIAFRVVKKHCDKIMKE